MTVDISKQVVYIIIQVWEQTIEFYGHLIKHTRLGIFLIKENFHNVSNKKINCTNK